MKFEWDARKSAANRGKHGIDFETAKALWFDEKRIEIEVADHRGKDEAGCIPQLLGDKEYRGIQRA